MGRDLEAVTVDQYIAQISGFCGCPQFLTEEGLGCWLIRCVFGEERPGLFEYRRPIREMVVNDNGLMVQAR